MSDNGSVVTGGTGQRSTVSRLLLNVANDGSFGEGGKGENVSDGEGGLLSAENESTGGESFSGDEGFGPHLVSVRVSEDNSGEGSSSVDA